MTDGPILLALTAFVSSVGYQYAKYNRNLALVKNVNSPQFTGASLHISSKLYGVPCGLYTFIWARVLLYLWKPMLHCYSVSDDLSCSSIWFKAYIQFSGSIFTFITMAEIWLTSCTENQSLEFRPTDSRDKKLTFFAKPRYINIGERCEEPFGLDLS